MNRASEKILPVCLAAAVLYICTVSFFRYRAAVQTAAWTREPVRVVIDAGHGGEDGGAVTAQGVRESGINLAICLRLRDLLAFCGVRPVMIRQTDTMVYSGECRSISEKKVSDLKNRVKTVNETPNALLLSIHQNHFSQAEYHGAQVFYAKTEGSRAFAEQMQTCLRDCVEPENRRQCKLSQSVYLLENIHCTGILIECGFLSNPAEAERLVTEEYQKELTAAVCGATVRYLSTEGDNYEV